MARRTALILALLLLVPVPGLASDLDADTLEGMDALVTDRWVAAAVAFEKAMAAAPEDEARQARLRAAREAGGYYWAARAETCATRGRWRQAAVCAGLARSLDPARPEVKAIVARVEKERPIPDVSVPPAASRAYPGRCPDVRMTALARLGADGERAADIVDGCLLGRVGPNGKVFAIKRKGRLVIRERGHLLLFVNAVDPSEARGEFSVEFLLK